MSHTQDTKHAHEPIARLWHALKNKANGLNNMDHSPVKHAR